MSLIRSRAVDPEPKQFSMAGAEAKNFQMVEWEPVIWVPDPQYSGQANYTVFFGP